MIRSLSKQAVLRAIGVKASISEGTMRRIRFLATAQLEETVHHFFEDMLFKRLHSPFAGRGDSSSVIFCGSFHACATYLIDNINQLTNIDFCAVSVDRNWSRRTLYDSPSPPTHLWHSRT